MRIAIITPSPNSLVSVEYAHSLVQTTLEVQKNLGNYQVTNQTFTGNQPQDTDRSVMVSTALRGGADKILMINPNQGWNWDQFKKLIESDKPIISGILPTAQNPVKLNFISKAQDNEFFSGDFNSGLQKAKDKYKTSEIEVAMIDTGFVCFDSKVFKAMCETTETFKIEDANGKVLQCWKFFETGIYKGSFFNDGLFFLAAKSLGFKAYIDIDLRIPSSMTSQFIIGSNK
jgi:hypothetical protein